MALPPTCTGVEGWVGVLEGSNPYVYDIVARLLEVLYSSLTTNVSIITL